jgi:hypothetical protein
MKICVIGAGTYGSYIINSLQNKHPEAEITLFEVGSNQIKSEEEIGYLSKSMKAIYRGLAHGRFFGFGGTSTQWAGQLLTFSKNDFKEPSGFLNEIVDLNIKLKESVLKKFNIKNNYEEIKYPNGISLKTGVWLSFFSRNFYKHFKISKRKNLKIISDARVSHFQINSDNSVSKVFYYQGDIIQESVFDYYFLACGAFEASRVLMQSNVIKSNKVFFSDHIAKKIFKISKGSKIDGLDFAFQIINTSLITRRFVGEIDGVSYYAHPVFNNDFPFFQSLKELMFKRNFSVKAVLNLFKDIPQAMVFIYYVIIKKRIYVKDGEWFLFIDIENPTKTSYVELSDQKDEYGLLGLNVHYEVDERAINIYNHAYKQVKQILINSNTVFEDCFDEIQVDTCEDIYHPYGMFSDYDSVKKYFNEYPNMLVVNTGILPRAGGINPTGAVLPLIDEFIENYKF